MAHPRILFLMFLLSGIFSIFPASLSAKNGADSPTTQTAQMKFPAAGEAPVVGQQDVEKMLKNHGSELLVVNFWATWCAPCVEELPYFVSASKEYKESDVRFLGISIDFHDQVDELVIPFLKKREIPYSNVVFFGKSEEMINFFSPEWSGAIPVTFIYDREGNQVAKILRPLSYEELKSAIENAREKGG
jgi:thiol-disulfide isomerase/thioredoxin